MNTTSPGARGASSAYLIFSLGLLMLVSTIRMADYELLAPLYGPISRELGINDLQFGMIRSVMDAVGIIGIISFGLLADRWRRRDLIAVGVTGWSAATWAIGHATGFAYLLVADAFMKFFQSTFSACLYPMVSDMVPRKNRGIVLGLMGTTFAIGTVLGLAVPALMGTADWRRPFVFFGAPGVVLGILVLLFLREPPRGGSEEGAEGGYTGSFTWKGLGKTLRTRTAVLVWLLDSCEGAVWFAFAFWTPAYLLRRGISPDADTAALALLPAIAGFVVGNVLGGWLTDRFRARTELSAVYVALASMTGSLVMMAIVFAMRDIRAVMVSGFIMGIFGHMIMSPISVMLYDVVAPETRSSATAFGGLVMAGFTSLSSLGIGAISHYAGAWKGLPEGDLRAGFQSMVTFFLAAGIIISLMILKTAPADMRALREHIAGRARLGTEEKRQ